MKNICLILLLSSLVLLMSGQNNFEDSLHLEIKAQTNDSLKAHQYFELIQFFNRKDAEKTKSYLDEVEVLVNKTGKPFLNSLTTYWRGLYLARRKKHKEAVSLLKAAIPGFQNERHKDFLRSSHYSLGKIFVGISDFPSAGDHFLAASKIAEKYQDTIHWSNSINALGVVNRRMGNYDSAYDLYQQAKKLAEEVKDNNGLFTATLNLAIIEKNKSQFEKAENSYLKAENIIHEKFNSDPSKLAAVYGNLSSMYKEKGEYQRALDYSLKTLELRKEKARDEEMANTYLGLAVVSQKLERYKQSLRYLETAEVYAKDNLEHEEKIYAVYSEVYKSQNKPQLAYEFLKKSSILRDSIFNLGKAKQLDELTKKYETEKKEQEITLLNTENELNQQRLKNSRSFNFLLGFGLIALIGFLTWLTRLYRRIRKADDEKSTLLKEIHHRVKNNMQVVSALLTLQSSYLKDNQAKEALREGQDRVESMALIHKNLYQHDNLKGVNTKEYLEKLTDNLLNSYKISKTDIELIKDIDDLSLDVDTMIPMGLMINEMISNALKHGFADQNKGKLEISLKERDNMLHLSVKDDGKGVENVDELQKKSFGYSLIKSFAKRLDADIDIDNSDGLSVSLKIKNYQKP